MVGAHLDQNVFKCAKLRANYRIGLWTIAFKGPENVIRNGVHSCAPNNIMLGYRRDTDTLLCRSLPNVGFVEWLDGSTQDPTFSMHICPTLGATMSGINPATNTFACLNEVLP